MWQALTEPEFGSDASSLISKATKVCFSEFTFMDPKNGP